MHGEASEAHSELSHIGVLVIAVLLCIQASRHAMQDYRRLTSVMRGQDDIDTVSTYGTQYTGYGIRYTVHGIRDTVSSKIRT